MQYFHRFNFIIFFTCFCKWQHTIMFVHSRFFMLCLMFTALACFLPYKSIFQKQLGLSETQNGIIMATEKAFSLLAPSLFGLITDKFALHKTMMIACAVATAFVTFPLYYVQPVVNQIVISTNGSCEAVRNGTIVTSLCNATECESCDPEIVDVYESTFFLVLLFSMLFVLTSVPLASLIDATGAYILGKDRLHLFGMQRLWGAVGFGLVGLLAGYLVDVYSKSVSSGAEKDYLPAFICLCCLQLITASVIFLLKVPEQKLTSLLHGISSLAKNPHISFLMFVVFISGFNLGTRYAFTFWYIEQLPGANPTLLGFSVLVGCFSEVPMFFVSGWILLKTGCPLVLTLGLLASALQCYLYTVISVAWPLVLIEALHGVSFALPIAAMCTFSAQLAPSGMTATLVGLTQGVYWGLGNMAGALVSGLLYKAYGAITMFRINSVIAVFGALLYSMTELLFSRCKRAENREVEVKVETREAMLPDPSQQPV